MAGLDLMASWANSRLQILGQDLGLLLLRLGMGAMLLTHGWPKYTGFADRAAKFSDPLGVGSPTSLLMAVFAEVVCAALVMLGLASRLAALVVAGTFVVITQVVHGADPFAKKELAFAYLLVYAVLVLTGPGRFSLDALISRRLVQPGKSAADQD